jgi:hypothetical protein
MPSYHWDSFCELNEFSSPLYCIILTASRKTYQVTEYHMRTQWCWSPEEDYWKFFELGKIISSIVFSLVCTPQDETNVMYNCCTSWWSIDVATTKTFVERQLFHSNLIWHKIWFQLFEWSWNWCWYIGLQLVITVVSRTLPGWYDRKWYQFCSNMRYQGLERIPPLCQFQYQVYANFKPAKIQSWTQWVDRPVSEHLKLERA